MSGLPARPDHYDDKWPRLVVDGKQVTRDQAEQIIVRTNGYWLHCNDQQWERGARKILGIRDPFDEIEDARRDEPGYLRALIDGQERDMDALGMLRLHYLNNSRISTSYIGGTHGWCNWDGRIGCGDYNIGKWPSCEEITSDWKLIAYTFPFLELRCQVVSMLYDSQYNEYPITMGRVWGTWTVANGRVEFDPDLNVFMGFPGGLKTGLRPEDFAQTMRTGGHRLTLEALAAVVARVRASLPKQAIGG